MTTFLLLFRAYRDLLTSNADLTVENTRLLGEAAAANARAEEADRRIEDLKRVADSYSFQATRRNIFARTEAPETPAVAVQMPTPRRQFARTVAAERTREAYQKQQQGVAAGLTAESMLTVEEPA